MDNPFAGIEEKLKRSDENIVNLNGEVASFFQTSDYPVIPHPDDKLWQKAIDYHTNRKIPLRFSVLAGEIVHHLRSCLDHVVWHFSDDTARRKHPTMLEFPVFKREPISEKEIARYEGKIQGISSVAVRGLIETLQPYHVGADGANHFIGVVHDMDRFDKHRELVIVFPIALLYFPPGLDDLRQKFILYQHGKLPKAEIWAMQRAVKDNAQVTPQIAFEKFGKWEYQAVIPALQQLSRKLRAIVSRFTELLPQE
jgi:hypothetical protein